MNLKVYFSSNASGALQHRQDRLFHYLDRLCLTHEKIDVAVPGGLDFLRECSPVGIILPQLYDHGRYLGGFDDFEGAVTHGRMHEFFYSGIQAKQHRPSL